MDIPYIPIRILIPSRLKDVNMDIVQAELIRFCPACTSHILRTKSDSRAKQQTRVRTEHLLKSQNTEWWCYACGLGIMGDNKGTMNIDRDKAVDKGPENEVDKQHKSVDNLKRASRAFEEEYIVWENKINKEFVDFLAHIRDFVTQKEGHLKEYQIDLCHRERSLQSNEDYFKERMATLKKAEEEFQLKVERLNVQIQDRMQRLRTLEAQKHRASAGFVDIGTQTESFSMNGPVPGDNTGAKRSDGDYMYMGAGGVNGDANYIESNGNSQVILQQETVTVDTCVNDSGFNTPDVDEISPAYRYENVPPGMNHPTNKPNTDAHTQPDLRHTNSIMNGERATLVKRPSGIDSYTSRALEYRSGIATRSRSVPPQEEHKPRDRSLSPGANRSRSVPPEPEHEKVNNNRVESLLNDQFRNRPASFAEGQRSPDAIRSRVDSFGSRSVNGHTSRKIIPSGSHKPQSRARSLRHKVNDEHKTIDNTHSRSLSVGNEPIGEESREGEHPNTVHNYIPDTHFKGDKQVLNSSSVTNLDDPRLRESIMTKSKQASSFNMNDAIARYKAKSENIVNHDISDSSSSSKAMHSPTFDRNMDSDTGNTYDAKSRQMQSNSIPAGTYPEYRDPPGYVRDHNIDINNTHKSRLPSRRSAPFESHNRSQQKLASSYPHSDSNILKNEPRTTMENFSNSPVPAHSQYNDTHRRRITSPKPILKNPIKPVESYHSTYVNNESGYPTSRLQQPSTKTIRRYDAPPPIRRYPSDGDTNKDRISIKSSTSDLAHTTRLNGGYQGDSSSSHGSNNATHENKMPGESPDMTSTPRDILQDNSDRIAITNSQKDFRNRAPDLNENYMGTFKGGQSNTQHANIQSQYRSTQLSHPMLGGKISLRDKSTWAIKKRREQTKTGEPQEESIERQSRSILAPGTYQRGLTKESRARSDPRVTASTTEPPPQSPGGQGIPVRTRLTRIPQQGGGGDTMLREGSPTARKTAAYNRRSHSSEGYLEHGGSRTHYQGGHGAYIGDGGNHYNPTAAGNAYQNGNLSPPPTYNGGSPRTRTLQNSRPRSQHDIHISKQFDNEFIERCSDSETEIQAPKKEHKKKTGFKSKLKGLYKGSSSKNVSKVHASSNDGQGNSVNYQRSNSNQEPTMSPKHRSKLPNYNTYSKTEAK